MNYPSTVRHDDPRAPWNQKEFEKCQTGVCFYCDEENLELNDLEQCEDCFYEED